MPTETKPPCTVADVFAKACAYRNALLAADNDAIGETAHELDMVLFGPNAAPCPDDIRDALLATYDDERDFDEAAEEIVEAVENLLYNEQGELIRKEHGEKASAIANYGWGVNGDETETSIATKVYDHGVLQSSVQWKTGEVAHDWLDF